MFHNVMGIRAAAKIFKHVYIYIHTCPTVAHSDMHDSVVMPQVPDEDLVDRVAGRRLDPETGDIYHLKHKPPPEDVKDRLIQRSDDTAEKVKTRLQSHHSNVDAVLDYYKDVLVEVLKVSISVMLGPSLADLYDPPLAFGQL